MGRIGLVAVWVLATTLTTSMAWNIVAAVDDRVSDHPLSVVQTAASLPDKAPDEALDEVPDVTPGGTPGNEPPTSTATTVAEPDATEFQSDRKLKTILSEGGVVVVSHRPGEVELEAASPTPGYSLEILDTGPSGVVVLFHGHEDVTVEAYWEDDELHIDISEADEPEPPDEEEDGEEEEEDGD